MLALLLPGGAQEWVNNKILFILLFYGYYGKTLINIFYGCSCIQIALLLLAE